MFTLLLIVAYVCMFIGFLVKIICETKYLPYYGTYYGEITETVTILDHFVFQYRALFDSTTTYIL